ncbi:MAG: hypothetical protein JNM98_21320 [Rhodocyclaceae bacterium]|nr:hypothetical protein [Rhodocyclaceae bacterium]
MSEPRALFLNMNGSGMGHLNRCLAYARRLQGRMKPVFFSLASAIEVIEHMGFEADYFVSHFWSASPTFAWNSELAIRFGMVLERVRPAVVVFDGTWPFQGFMTACAAYGAPALVWSNRGLLKPDAGAVPIDVGAFDLVIQPGELNATREKSSIAGSGNKIVVPPVCLLDETEILDRASARRELELSEEGRYALFSLGPGNLKDVSGIGHALIRLCQARSYEVVWARAPISIRDVDLPAGVKAVSLYPLARYMRAFDAFVGAAGYNTCCEVVLAQIPSLLVPNLQLVDDQAARARIVATLAPALVSSCESEAECRSAIDTLLALPAAKASARPHAIRMDGARLAADRICALAANAEPAP